MTVRPYVRTSVHPYIRTSVRPSVRTTGIPIHFLHWIEACAESCVFSARNRMLTRVVAKQAKTKEKEKEHSVVFLVEGEKFNLGERNSAMKFRQKVQICLVGSVQTRSAHRLSSQLFAAVSTPNIAELVLFGFFCPQPWFLPRFEHILPGKTPAFSC